MAVDLTALNNDYDLLLAFPLIEENIVATAKWFEGINPIGGVSDGVKRWSTSGYVERYQGSTSSFVPLEWSKVVFGNSFGIVDDADIGLTISLDGSNQTLLDAANGLLLRVNGTDVIKAYASGFAGVNTANPAYAWDVTGDINFTGTLYNNGSAVSLVTQTYVDAADTNLQSQITTLGTTDTSLQNQINTLGTTDTSLQTQITTLTSVIAQTSANFRGEWSSATTYQQYDQVLRNGIRYYSQVSSNLNNDPASSPTEWSLFVNVFSGNVGIGTNAPTDKLHVYSNTGLDHILIDGDEGINRALGFASSGSARWNLYTDGSTETGTGNSGSNFRIARYSDTGTYLAYAMQIDRSSGDIEMAGNVGIGTSAPSGKLDVNTGVMSGDVKIGNFDNVNNGTGSNTHLTQGTKLEFIADTNPRYSNHNTNTVAFVKAEYDGSDSSADVRTGNTALTFATHSGFADSGTLSEKMRISSFGNVGIGTSSPSGDLHIESDSTSATQLIMKNTATGGKEYHLNCTADSSSIGGGKFALRDATANAYRMTIDSSGKVGIGTSAPGAKLEIDNGGVGEYLRVGGDDSDNARALKFTSSNSSTNSIGALHTIKANSTAGEIAFDNGNGNIMYLKNDGNVGIGTSSPDALFEVQKDNDIAFDATQDDGQASGTATIRVSNQDGTQNSFSQILFDTAGTHQSIARIAAIRTTNSTNDLAFAVENANTKFEAMRIKGNGKVGIGTSAPDAALTVMTDGDTNSDGIILRSSSAGGRTLRLWATGDTAHIGAGNGTLDLILNHAGGKVGIGTSSPSEKFYVATGEAHVDYASTPPLKGSALRLATNTTHSFICSNQYFGTDGTGGGGNGVRRARNGGCGNIAFDTTSTSTAGDIKFETSPNSTQYALATLTERMRIKQAGDVQISTGNLVIGTAGKGIDFGVASGSVTSQLLDDYEEGTWTPVIADAGTGGNTATGNFVGTYTKVGRKVTATGQCRNINTTGLTSTNDLFIRSLPFINGINMAQYGTVRIEYASFSGYCVFMVYGLTTYAKVIEVLPNAQNDALTPADLTSGTSFINFTVTYETS